MKKQNCNAPGTKTQNPNEQTQNQITQKIGFQNILKYIHANTSVLYIYRLLQNLNVIN